MAEQELLLVIESGLEKGPPLAPEPPKIAPPARLKEIDRNQSYWGAVAIEELIPADHLARAIWDVTEKVDFSGFLKDNKSVEGKQGGSDGIRGCWRACGCTPIVKELERPGR